MKKPTLVIDAVIKSSKGILLIKRAKKPYKGFWCLPGGHVEYGERVEGAVKREIEEETGLKIKIKELIGVFDDPRRDPRGHYVSLCFLAEIVGGKVKEGKEVAEIKFFKKVPEKVGFDHKLMLEKVMGWKD